MADQKLSALAVKSTISLADQLYGQNGGTHNAFNVDRLLAFMAPHLCQGRLTTETGVPVSTADRTAWYQGTQGSRLMPAAWARALEKADSQDLFFRYGFEHHLRADAGGITHGDTDAR